MSSHRSHEITSEKRTAPIGSKEDESTSISHRAHISEVEDPKTVSETLSWPLWVITVLSILSSIFLFALDNTVVADIQPRVIETFGGAIEKLPWLSVAFPLGNCSLNLVW